MSISNLYALLIGIDNYVSPVTSLQGCVNDILSFKNYLEGRTKPEQLQIKTLLNEAATREAVIAGFRDFLSQAKENDLALFYYAGHGAQEESPEAFWQWEPDRLNETLVCYDSRSENKWDLADKELAKLIAEVSHNNPQIVVILDCCHSGSGTRGELESDTAVRKMEMDRRHRPLESFLFSPQELEMLTGSLNPEENPSGWSFPKGKHIVLSACRDTELAKEYNGNGQRRGAFSYFLLDTLIQTNGNLTYRDLFKRTNALLRAKVAAQSPQLEATNLKDLDRSFLGGAIAEFPNYFTVSYHPDYDWIMDGGAVHGIQVPMSGETTHLALFPFNSSPEQLRDRGTIIAQAEVINILPQLSQIKITGLSNLDPDQTFKALITQIPLPPKGVFLTGESEGILTAQGVLEELNSPYLQAVNTVEQAEFKLLAKNEKFLITRPADDRPLVAAIEGYSPDNAQQAIQQLEHIIRWTTILGLNSVATTRLRSDAVQLTIYHNGQECIDSQIRLQYQQKNGKSQSPSFKVKLKNNSNEPLYCALLDLTDRYAISSELLPGGGLWLNPQEEFYALNGEPIYAEVPKNLWKKGITEVKDILKLMVSTAEFDATLLEQGDLDLPARAIKTGSNQGTINRLANRIQSRALSAKPEEEKVFDDWLTSQIVITTVRPLLTNTIPSSGDSLELGCGVTIQSHGALKAQVRLTSVNQSTRDLGNHILPPLLQNQTGIEAFNFTNSRGTDPGLSALELSQVEDISVVTKANPLKLTVAHSLAENEQILVIAYDGEFFLPLGTGFGTEIGTEIVLERLPEPISEGSRSLGGSIRIFFQKVMSEKFSLPFDYPLLAIAEVSPNETVTYYHDLAQIQAKVAQAQTIALYIHGIIGDTESIVKSVQRAQLIVNDQEKSLAEIYDLILTFDYENLNTTIEENARLLKQRLESVGLGANHGKNLQIIAHSMGGLVSRWFIEREGGNAIVQQLIMLGTPNNGSPWSTVEDWAIAALSFALNGLTQITWPVPILGLLVKAINEGVKSVEKIDHSLDQMQPNSEFLQQLAASSDPGIPYQIIAGNVSLSPQAFGENASNSPGERLLQKLFQNVVALPFFGQPNDIAVTTTSIQHLPANRQRLPHIQEVACDHLVYFSHPIGLNALAIAVSQALDLPNTELSKIIPEVSENLPKTEVETPLQKPKSFLWLIILVFVIGILGLTIFAVNKNSQEKTPNPQTQS